MAKKRIGKAAFGRLEAICARLPDTVIEPAYDHYRIRVRKNVFAWQLNDHHGDGRIALALKAPLGVQQSLVEMDPERFFVPAYVGKQGWVGVMLEGAVDWKGVERLLRDAWRLSAPKKLVAEVDGAQVQRRKARAPAKGRGGRSRAGTR